MVITPKPTRTADPLLRRQLLYPLSYRGPVRMIYRAVDDSQAEGEGGAVMTCRLPRSLEVLTTTGAGSSFVR